MFEHQTDQAALVRWAANIGAVTPQAVAHNFQIGLPSARARLARAQRAGLLGCARPLEGSLVLFTVTRQGLRSVGARGIDPCRVSAANARHLAACAEVAARLSRCYPHHRLQGERELRRDEREHQAPLASARLPSAGAAGERLHRPDLVLWAPECEQARPVAIEVELTIKSPRRLAAICRAWGRCREVDGVIYLISDEVERPLRRAIERANALDLLVVLPLRALGEPRIG